MKKPELARNVSFLTKQGTPTFPIVLRFAWVYSSFTTPDVPSFVTSAEGSNFLFFHPVSYQTLELERLLIQTFEYLYILKGFKGLSGTVKSWEHQNQLNWVLTDREFFRILTLSTVNQIHYKVKVELLSSKEFVLGIANGGFCKRMRLTPF